MDDVRDLIRACEARIVNAWPAVDTLIMGDWVVRLAGGYSGRANSATPLWPGAAMDETLLDAIVALYGCAGLPACVRITPLADPSVATLLAARGFVLRDQSLGMIASFGKPGGCRLATEPDASVSFDDHATDSWVRGVSALQGGDKHNADDRLMAIVGRIRVAAHFATLTGADGMPVGFGLCVVERGMAELGSIIVAPGMRGRGYGRALVAALMQRATEAGARRVFLQVEAGNTPAIGLYASFGFDELYRYRTLILPLRHDG